MMRSICVGGVAERCSACWHRAIDDLQHAAAGEQLVFHQRDVGLDAGRVAIHEEGDRAGRREHGDLRVAIAVLLTESRAPIPSRRALLLSGSRTRRSAGCPQRFAMQFDDSEHRLDVVLRDRLRDAAHAHRGSPGTAPSTARFARSARRRGRS